MVAMAMVTMTMVTMAMVAMTMVTMAMVAKGTVTMPTANWFYGDSGYSNGHHGKDSHI